MLDNVISLVDVSKEVDESAIDGIRVVDVMPASLVITRLDDTVSKYDARFFDVEVESSVLSDEVTIGYVFVTAIDVDKFVD